MDAKKLNSDLISLHLGCDRCGRRLVDVKPLGRGKLLSKIRGEVHEITMERAKRSVFYCHGCFLKLVCELKTRDAE